MPPAPADLRPMVLRENALARFARVRFGLRGSLRLHRAALGPDLLRAPVNVALAPVFLALRLTAAALRRCGAVRASAWLAARRIFLTADLTRQVEHDLTGLFADLAEQGLAPEAPPEAIRRAISAYAETRTAVAEITTSALLLITGFVLFLRPTPGVISLAEPMTQMRVQSRAIGDFMLGEWAGRAWYGWFPTEVGTAELIATGLLLAVAASVISTFAGLIADPIQVWTGIHKQRLLRMMARLDRQQDIASLEREHLLARLGDLGDIAASLWRGLR